MTVDIRNGKIHVDGADQGLEIAEHQSLEITVTGIRKSRTARVVDGKRWDDTRLYGVGTLEGTLGVVGSDIRQKTVDVIVQSAPASEPHLDWQTFLGLAWADPEVSDKDSWAIQTRIPADLWAVMVAEFDAGRVQEIALSIEVPLWAKPMPFFHNPKPHLMFAPEKRGGHAMGKATSITWGTETTAISTLPSEMPIVVEDDGRIRQILTWGIPAIVALLAYIAVRG
jgi:hypothetical protein